MKILSLLIFLNVGWAADAASFAERKAHIRLMLEREDDAPAAREAGEVNRQWLDDIETYQLLAGAQLGLGRYAEAEQSIQWMLNLRLGQADAAGYGLLARFREVTGDTEGAIEALNSALMRLQTGDAGNRAQVLAEFARLHLLAGKPKAAAKILAAAPADSVPVMAVQAELLTAQADRAAAAAAWRKVIAAAPQARYLYALAELTGEAPDYAAFVQAARAVAGAPANGNRELALYLAGAGQHPSEALDLARREAARRGDVFTQTALSVALVANGRQEEGRHLMESVLAVGTRHPAIVAHAVKMGVKVE